MSKPILPLEEIKNQIQKLPANAIDRGTEIYGINDTNAPKIRGQEYLAKQYLKKLKTYFPQKQLSESEEWQIVSNLMQNATKEGVFRSFIDDSSFYELLKTKRDAPSEKIKEFVRNLYLKYLFF